MMLNPAERLVKHSSTAGLGEGRTVSVNTGAPGSRRGSRRRSSVAAAQIAVSSR
jgi:hypothetical protein